MSDANDCQHEDISDDHGEHGHNCYDCGGDVPCIEVDGEKCGQADLLRENAALRAQAAAAEQDSARLTRERDEARALYQEVQYRLDVMEDPDKSPYVDCVCSGCPRKVPQAWVSGMCGPCADEDCEHEDGAKARIAELEESLTAAEELLTKVTRARETALEKLAAARREGAEAEKARLVGIIRTRAHERRAAAHRGGEFERDNIGRFSELWNLASDLDRGAHLPAPDGTPATTPEGSDKR